MSSFPYHYPQKKCNLQILYVTFCKHFFLKISKIELVSQTIIFIFSILKIVLKSRSQTYKI